VNEGGLVGIYIRQGDFLHTEWTKSVTEFVESDSWPEDRIWQSLLRESI
jgi:hypothetical protein